MTDGISAVLIVKDAQAFLERCLDSVSGADEIVVLDTGSTDRTVDIARSFARASVHVSEPIVPFHFAEARNRANALATRSWILSIDADEILRSGGMANLRRALSKQPDATALLTPFINNPERGRHVMTIRKIKVFRKDAWTWKYRIHEQLAPTGPSRIVTVSNAIFEHLPAHEKEWRHRQNIELLDLCAKENPEYIRVLRHLGQELMLEGRHEEAIPHLARYLDGTGEDATERSQVACYLARCYAKRGDVDMAVQVYDKAAGIAPARREPLFWAAQTLYESGPDRWEEAVRWLERTVAIPASSRPFSPQDTEEIWGSAPADILRRIRGQIAARRAGVLGRFNP
jgi:tetratricopeptide (TPR) repeat protein